MYGMTGFLGEGGYAPIRKSIGSPPTPGDETVHIATNGMYTICVYCTPLNLSVAPSVPPFTT